MIFALAQNEWDVRRRVIVLGWNNTYVIFLVGVQAQPL